MLATLIKTFGVVALVGIVVGVLVAAWVDPGTADGFRLIVLVVTFLVIIFAAILSAIMRSCRRRTSAAASPPIPTKPIKPPAAGP